MFYGERIRLRRDERTDLPKFVEWLNDPEVRRFISVNLPISQANEEGWFEGMLKRPPEEQPLAIEIREGESWRLVGNCGFFDIDRFAIIVVSGQDLHVRTDFTRLILRSTHILRQDFDRQSYI